MFSGNLSILLPKTITSFELSSCKNSDNSKSIGINPFKSNFEDTSSIFDKSVITIPIKIFDFISSKKSTVVC